MAKDNKERINRLTTYADMLRNRLTSEIPAKHKANPAAFKQMIETDLKRTLSDIERLRIG